MKTIFRNPIVFYVSTGIVTAWHTAPLISYWFEIRDVSNHGVNLTRYSLCQMLGLNVYWITSHNNFKMIGMKIV